MNHNCPFITSPNRYKVCNYKKGPANCNYEDVRDCPFLKDSENMYVNGIKNDSGSLKIPQEGIVV